nr:unnamed protein product [Callosobruchus chinensis]
MDSTRSLCDLDYCAHAKYPEDFARSWNAHLEGSSSGVHDCAVSMSADDLELYMDPCSVQNQECLQELRNAPFTLAYPPHVCNEDGPSCVQRRHSSDFQASHRLTEPPYVRAEDLRNFACVYEPCCHLPTPAVQHTHGPRCQIVPFRLGSATTVTLPA